MSNHLQLFSTSCIVLIAVWASWAILSSKVRDGVLGKIIYSVIAISGYALVVRGELPWVGPTAGTTFLFGLACAGVRHIVVVTWWQRIKVWVCTWLRCEHCLADPRFGAEPGKTERRKP